MTTTLPSTRVAAIDVFRAITMFMMLWVNDFWSIDGVPHWMEHAARAEDMMGFSDTVFPAFLFIMGVSIPFAIQNRLRKGESILGVMLHVALRSLALMLMGLFIGNYQALGPAIISRPWFAILMVVGFFLVWAVYPKTEKGKDLGKKILFTAMRIIGIGVLVFLYSIYVGRRSPEFSFTRWEILGLIGWSYLVTAAVYLIVRNKPLYNFIAWGVMVAYCILNRQGIVGNPLPGGITLHAFGVSGLLVASIMQKYASPQKPGKFLLWMGGMAAVLAVAGFVAHNFWIISKIQATPTWLFWCLAMFLPLFGLIYWLTETKGKAHWFRFIAPAGTVTLTCYVIPYVWYSVRTLIHYHRPEIFGEGAMGLLGCLIYAWLVVMTAGLLSRYLKIRLKI